MKFMRTGHYCRLPTILLWWSEDDGLKTISSEERSIDVTSGKRNAWMFCNPSLIHLRHLYDSHPA